MSWAVMVLQRALCSVDQRTSQRSSSRSSWGWPGVPLGDLRLLLPHSSNNSQKYRTGMVNVAVEGNNLFPRQHLSISVA